MEKERKYRSKRLEGLQGNWSDIEVLLFAKNKVDFRSSHPDLTEALDKRITEIIEKLEKYEEFKSIHKILQGNTLLEMLLDKGYISGCDSRSDVLCN